MAQHEYTGPLQVPHKPVVYPTEAGPVKSSGLITADADITDSPSLLYGCTISGVSCTAAFENTENGDLLAEFEHNDADDTGLFFLHKPIFFDAGIYLELTGTGRFFVYYID